MGRVDLLCAEKWVKQSHRSRFEISGPNKRLLLSIPTIKSSRTILKEVQIEEGKWKQLHWRSLTASYANSPYFEYYADELKELWFKEEKSLLSFSLELLRWLNKRLQLDIDFQCDEDTPYLKNEIEWKSELEPYQQVFSDKREFEKDLSALDLLFNTGPEAAYYF